MKFDLKSSPRHIQRLTNIASVISGINGIYVIIDNKVSTPYFNTQNNVCVLPNGDYSDERFVKLIEGFICHEAGHGRYTEHEVYREAFVGELINADGFISIDDDLKADFQNLKQKQKAYARACRLKGLINLFDDVQMEEKTGIDYQEAKKRLAVTYALMVEAGRMTVDISSTPQNPVQFIEMYLLNTLRVNVLQQEGHKETLDPFFDYAKKILAPVTSEVDEIIHQALSCKSTQNCDSLARKTLALLERLRDEAKEKQQEEEQSKDPHDDLALRMNLIPNPMVIARVKGMVIKKVKAMILVMVRRLRKVMGYRTNPEGMNKMLRTLTANLMVSLKVMNRRPPARMMLTRHLP